MSNRLSKITTRTGDDGSTGLADNSRARKDAPRIEALGAIDELNSALGLLLTEDLPQAVRDCLDNIQHDLFDLGGELSLPGHTLMTDAHSARLEQALEQFNAALPPLKEFILPGGSRAASFAHLARTLCRRAERALVTLANKEPVEATMLCYINRLSDLLFVLARALNRHAGITDVYWQPGKNRG
jgi:cob(I)alamin adenosyltransferase